MIKSMRCQHELYEQEVAVADGYCPMCLCSRIAELEGYLATAHARLDYLEKDLGVWRSTAQNRYDEIERLKERMAELEKQKTLSADEMMGTGKYDPEPYPDC